ncbi:MAG: cysteine desulfurase [Cytophagales bacterium]|nr:cysteine desulfurase [Cytophagales bacterium]
MSDDKKIIYLDNAATTRMYQSVVDKMYEYYIKEFYNPSGVYESSQEVRRAVNAAREFLASTIKAKQEEVFFTSCGTESDNWVIKGLAARFKKGHIITSKIEHHAVIHPLKTLEKNGFTVTYLDVDRNGFINLETLKRSLRPETFLVTIMYANNEIGTIEQIKEIGMICRQNNILFHSDAVQAYGHIPIDVVEDNIDLLSVSGHKLGGPKGIGFLYKKTGVILPNLLEGGAQEKSKRAGTENVAGIIGLAEAAKISFQRMKETINYETSLRNYFIERVLKEIPYCHLNGDAEKRLPNNINISFHFIEGESLLLSLNRYGICCATGSACSSESLEPSHVLLAIGLTHEKAHGTLRFTINYETQKDDIDYTIDILKKEIEHLRSMSPLYEDFIKNTTLS